MAWGICRTSGGSSIYLYKNGIIVGGNGFLLQCPKEGATDEFNLTKESDRLHINMSFVGGSHFGRGGIYLANYLPYFSKFKKLKFELKNVIGNVDSTNFICCGIADNQGSGGAEKYMQSITKNYKATKTDSDILAVDCSSIAGGYIKLTANAGNSNGSLSFDITKIFVE